MHIFAIFGRSVLGLATLATAAMATATEVELDITQLDGKTKIVWQNDGKSRQWQFDSVDLSNTAALEQAFADLPAEQRQQLIAELTALPKLTAEGAMPEDDSGAVKKRIIKRVERAGGEQHKVVMLHKGQAHNDFELLKTLLQDASLSAEQLQQLQAVLDSKR